MAANKIVIGDIQTAIDNGLLKCKITENRRYYEFDPINYTLKSGKSAVWIIRVSLYSSNDKRVKLKPELLTAELSGYAKIEVENSQAGGKVREFEPEIVSQGKNIGRANETNVLSQAIKNANSKYNKQLQKSDVGIDSYMKPLMLVKKLGENKDSTLSNYDDITVQIKFNGIRMGACYYDGKVRLYSRGLKPYDMPKIEKALTVLFKQINIDNLYLDGEAYIEGKPLNFISGEARKEGDSDLSFYVYDLFILDKMEMIYSDRKKLRDTILSKCPEGIINVADTKVNSMDDMMMEYKKYLKMGYEGLIIRRGLRPYEFCYNSYHSSNILKLKPLLEDEFEVVDYTEGEKGKHSGAIVWICKAGNDVFHVVPKMKIDERKDVYIAMGKKVGDTTVFEKYIKGLMLTIEYAEKSETGKPLRGNSVAFRAHDDKKGIEGLKYVSDKFGLNL